MMTSGWYLNRFAAGKRIFYYLLLISVAFVKIGKNYLYARKNEKFAIYNML